MLPCQSAVSLQGLFVLSILSGGRTTFRDIEPPADDGHLRGVTMDQPTPTPPSIVDDGPSLDGGYLVPPVPVAGATAIAVPSQSRSVLYAKIGVLGIAAAAIVAAAILVFGSGTSPLGTLAAGTTNGTTAGAPDLLNGGPGFRGGPGFGGITITAINGNNISLKTADGWTRTITVDSGTTYSKSGATIALGDLKVGDEVGFRQTRETDGTFTIDSIAVILPHAGGEVTATTGSTITVKGRDGSTTTIKVTGQTTYTVNGNSAKLGDVKVGMVLIAEGTKAADGSLTATQVKAADAGSLSGKGDHLGRGFGFDFGPDLDGSTPSSTAAPSATGSAS